MAAPARSETIDASRARRMPGSAALHARAKETFPDGVTHDGRYHDPFPIYCTHAEGPRKWDVDGNEYIDYFGGHGALLLGHGHPAIVEAEIVWGELVKQIVPSARGGMVKFTSSGTEATMLAMRMARAVTGKDVICKAEGAFHGWHDYATMAMQPPYGEPIAAGVPEALWRTVAHVPPRDIDALAALLGRRDDIAAVIVIADQAGEEYLRAVRELTAAKGVLLIFDEVVTGFRYAPGGAQEYYGVTPDLTTLAKILAGGLNGGAVAGRADLFANFLQSDDRDWVRHERTPHPGTYNGNPLSAAAGIAMLEIAKDPAIQKRAIATADAIRAGMNDAFARHGIAGKAGGPVSLIPVTFAEPKINAQSLIYRFRSAMQLGGVDPSGMQLIVSAVHGPREIDQTVVAFDAALGMLKDEGAL